MTIKIETKATRATRKIELGGGSDSNIILEIGKDDQQKINEWLIEILGNGEGIYDVFSSTNICNECMWKCRHNI